jgi:hypothetical protein
MPFKNTQPLFQPKFTDTMFHVEHYHKNVHSKSAHPSKNIGTSYCPYLKK